MVLVPIIIFQLQLEELPAFLFQFRNDTGVRRADEISVEKSSLIILF